MKTDDFLSRYDEDIAAVARILCEKIACMVPKAQQKVYPGWKVIGFSFDDGMKSSFAGVAPQKSHVNLFFNRGASLPDEQGLLEGAGKTARHIKIRTMREPPPARLNRYIKSAAKLAEGARGDSKKIAGMSSEAVKKATGKSWQQWLTLLDRAGAKAKDHKAIVALVGDTDPGLSGWWRQQVTVGYEQARGLRLLHEKPGGFEISKSKTVEASAAKLFDAFKNARKRTAWLGEKGIRTRTATANKSIRMDWSDGKTIFEARFYRKGAGRCSVTVQHMKLGSAKQAEAMKTLWGERLERLKERLEA